MNAMQGFPAHAAELRMGVRLQRACHSSRCWGTVPVHTSAYASLGGSSCHGSKQRIGCGVVTASKAVQEAKGPGWLIATVDGGEAVVRQFVV